MKMKKFAGVCFATVVVLVVGAAGAWAGNRPYAFTVTPQGGMTVFEGNRGLDPAYYGGLSLGYNFSEHWGAEALMTYGETETSNGTAVKVEALTGRLDLLYHLQPKQRLVPNVGLSLGGVNYDRAGSYNLNALAGYGVGVKYFLPEGVALRLDLRHLFEITIGDSNPERNYYNNLDVSAGVMFQFGGEKMVLLTNDTDGDGIVDAYDRCAATRSGVAVDGSGCPFDADRDGVYDYLDACADSPPREAVDNQGCPLDSDADGVVDQTDRCPQTPAGATVDAAGCPAAAAAVAVAANDGDGDGVDDARDRCPNTPTFVPVNENGCPRDSDADGIFDVEDQCPNSPPGSSVDVNGCSPLEGGLAVAPMVESIDDALVLRMEFHPGETTILPQFEAQLAKAGLFIAQSPFLSFVVEGHTDSVGPSEYNRELSRKRAESVRNYLISRFQIEPSRLKAVGKGEGDPVGDNSTQEGRMQNRRVVIKPAN